MYYYNRHQAETQTEVTQERRY